MKRPDGAAARPEVAGQPVAPPPQPGPPGRAFFAFKHKPSLIMSLSKREFLQVLAPPRWPAWAWRATRRRRATAEQGLYDLPPLGSGAGHVSFLHMTDCHAQLKPIYFREPSVNLGIGRMQGQLPHLVGEHLLKKAGVRPGTPLAHAYTYLDFEKRRAALRQGRRLRAPGHAGQAAEGQPPRRAAARRRRHLAGQRHQRCGPTRRTWSTPASCSTVDVMTGHWEFTYGMERVKEIVEKDFGQGRLRRAERQDRRLRRPGVQAPYVIREMNGVQGGHRRPGLPVHADRQPALHGRRLGVRHPGRQHAEGGRRGARQGRAGGRGAQSTTAWTST
jgi:hypothetical protein